VKSGINRSAKKNVNNGKEEQEQGREVMAIMGVIYPRGRDEGEER